MTDAARIPTRILRDWGRARIVAAWHLALVVGHPVESGETVEWDGVQHEAVWQSAGAVWLVPVGAAVVPGMTVASGGTAAVPAPQPNQQTEGVTDA